MSESFLSTMESDNMSAAQISTAAFAGRSRKSNVQYTITTCGNVQKQTESSYKEGRSSLASSQQGAKVSTHFGRHLLQNLKIVTALKVKNSNIDCRMSDEESIETSKKNTVFSFSSIHARSVSRKKVVPFCEELLIASKESNSQSPSSFSSSYTLFEAMEQSTPHKEYCDWSNPMSPSSFCQDGATTCDLLQNHQPKVQNQRQQLDTQFKPNEAALQDFKKLGLSFDQVLGLEYLGFKVSRFLPALGLSSPHDSRIPPSFDIDGASCYFCESAQHIAYGVAFILKDDSRVIGVEVERSRHSDNVALIQIAIADVVLLIPMSTESISPPKAIQIIFRDTEIIKTGVNIEMNLKALWVNFEIESNSFVELNELLKFCSPEFWILSSRPESPLTLQAIATVLGYQNWQTKEVILSTWECRPLSWEQLCYAATNALITVRIFWRIVFDSRVSKHIHTADLQMNIGQFVDSICKRGAISKKYDDDQITHHGLRYELPSHQQQVASHRFFNDEDTNKNDSFGFKDDRLSISPTIPPGFG